MSQDRKIKLCAPDMHKVFEFPCGRTNIHGIDAQTTASIDFLKKNIGMVGNDSHGLKAAEIS